MGVAESFPLDCLKIGQDVKASLWKGRAEVGRVMFKASQKSDFGFEALSLLQSPSGFHGHRRRAVELDEIYQKR